MSTIQIPRLQAVSFLRVMSVGRTKPRIEKLKPAYAKALNILNKMPVTKDFVTEQDAAKFSQELAQVMAAHPPSEESES